ncbi:hypothetical protein SME05J_46260 [Serratia marcescens]|nr:hypothetical protein SME05J_46260 [Serratia marcescens]
MEQRNKPEMDVEAMLLEQALRERVDAAFERLRNGTAVYLSHSEAEKRMALFKVKIRGRYRGEFLTAFIQAGTVSIYVLTSSLLWVRSESNIVLLRQ